MNNAIVMDTRAERRLSGGAHVASLEVQDQVSFPSLTDVAFALPWKIARTTGAFLWAGATRLRGDSINVPSMSGDWLVQYEVACGKHGDPL